MAPGIVRPPTILLPLDLSPAGETKIPVAIEYARLLSATVVLLHVLPRRALDPAEVRPTEASARTYLDTIAAQVEAAGVTAATVVRRGSPSATILAEAALLQPRLMILSSSPHRPLLASVVHNTVADQVMRGAPCPVLVVHSSPSIAPTDPLRSFADDAARSGSLTRRHLGVRTIEVSRIVGSLERSHELGPDFRRRGNQKVTSLDVQRFQRVLEATRDGIPLPPISVYKLGFGYYVEDGHHRVAAARLEGQTEIEADVTEFVPSGDERMCGVFAARTAFERATGLTSITGARPETYTTLLQAIQTYAAREAMTELPLAARRWERTVFRPLWQAVREQDLAAAFPGDLSADVVARTIANAPVGEVMSYA